jgi:NAD(P)-dependent dehydrogenase (short-subunit alcohol dehydrogenase family)
MSTALITGAATGIGNLTAQALAKDGHVVYASMRDVEGHNSAHAQEMRALADRDHLDLHVVELDVTSQDSADAAVATVLEEQGELDVVMHNAGHLYVGYVEAFSAEDIARLFDVNVFGVQRVNRAVLPHMRERHHGTLLYTGSTIVITTPPFLGPYSSSKAAMDQLALTTAYEVSQQGVETVIVCLAPSRRALSTSRTRAGPATPWSPRPTPTSTRSSRPTKRRPRGCSQRARRPDHAAQRVRPLAEGRRCRAARVRARRRGPDGPQSRSSLVGDLRTSAPRARA